MTHNARGTNASRGIDDDRGTRKCLEERNLTNRKPYRPKAEKVRAKTESRKQHTGQFVSWVPVIYHA